MLSTVKATSIIRNTFQTSYVTGKGWLVITFLKSLFAMCVAVTVTARSGALRFMG
jgi:hypothetical protein